MLFTGEFAHTIDAKQRLAIPAEIRTALAAAAGPVDPSSEGESDAAVVLYAVLGPNGALWIWPEATFLDMVNLMDQSLVPTDEQMSFDELFFPHASRLQLDAAGRARLPERLTTQAGLGSTVVILGVRDHLELRDQDAWEERRAAMLARQGEIMLQARRAALQGRQGAGGQPS